VIKIALAQGTARDSLLSTFEMGSHWSLSDHAMWILELLEEV
jgi:hypothetical protein